MASNFPKLPGAVPTQDIDSQWFRRVSANQQEKNRDIKNVQPTSYKLPRQREQEQPDQSGMFNSNYISTTHDSFRPKNLQGEINDITTRFQPDYVYMDRQTLRFHGYFQESVCESNLESYRVRKVTIYYYLDDNTISMIEPKQMNSGIPQGVFLKRQKVLKQDSTGEFLGIDDFKIGQNVIIFGKNITINACDQYTREFYELNRLPLEQDQNVEVGDNWTTKTFNKPQAVKDYALTDYMEHKLGGGKPTSAKQFLENDRKVLKFYVYSDNPYILHYFLADDTIEIREINFQNSGKDPFPLLLRRQKQPRKFALNQPGQTYAEDYIKPTDIQYGEAIDIFGRKFVVQGCDPYTNRYFNEKYQIDFPVGSIEQPQPKALPQRQIPPFNGFGNEEDSLGYVYRLVPKAPKKDFFKWVDNQVNLRFWARFNTNKPEDVQRRFIITFFLNDDSLMVYEPDQRNSGIVSGKFLERSKYKNLQCNNRFFQPTDFVVGRDIIINGTSFHIEEADDFSKNWFSQHVQVNRKPL